MPRVVSSSCVEACPPPISFHRPVCHAPPFATVSSHSCAMAVRGGHLPSSSHDNNNYSNKNSHDLSDDEQEDDNDDSDDVPEEDRYDRRPQGRRPLPSTTSRREGPPQRRPPGHQRRSTSQQRKSARQPGVLSAATKLVKTTADMTTAAAWTTLKGSGKAAMYLLSSKHVTRPEIYGVWRLDQSITTRTSARRGKSSSSDSSSSSFCAANVEFTSRGDVLVRFEGRTTATPYIFRERQPYWPQSSATIEFEAKAFQGPQESSPQVLLRYKGYFRRKLADPSVIKIVGHIYAVQKLGWRRGDGKKIGSFVARRRLQKGQRKSTVVVEEYEDDWDDDDIDNVEEEEDALEGGFDEDEERDEVDAGEFDEEEDFDRDDDDDYE